MPTRTTTSAPAQARTGAMTATERERANLRLLRIRDTMDRRYGEPLDIVGLARSAHLSPAHFSRRFTATFGETPHRYLQRRRIERAAFLLRESRTPITDICLAVGFSSLGTFSRTFRSVMGVSPSQYRRDAAPAAVFSCVAAALMRPAAVSEKPATVGRG
jgi:AraC-like DNA-binding protein